MYGLQRPGKRTPTQLRTVCVTCDSSHKLAWRERSVAGRGQVNDLPCVLRNYMPHPVPPGTSPRTHRTRKVSAALVNECGIAVRAAVRHHKHSSCCSIHTLKYSGNVMFMFPSYAGGDLDGCKFKTFSYSKLPQHTYARRNIFFMGSAGVWRIFPQNSTFTPAPVVAAASPPSNSSASSPDTLYLDEGPVVEAFSVDDADQEVMRRTRRLAYLEHIIP